MSTSLPVVYEAPMSDNERVFIVEVTHEKTYRVIVGGPNGSIRLEGEIDEDAAADMVDEHVHLSEFMLPKHITIEENGTTIEQVRELLDAKPKGRKQPRAKLKE